MTTQNRSEASLIPTIQNMHTAYDAINHKFYKGKLPKTMITVNKDDKKSDSASCLGYCTTYKAWHSCKDGQTPAPDFFGEEGFYEINICSDYLYRGKEKICEVLMHEMVHLYCNVNGIQDMAAKGRYHNKNFKREAEAHGLVCGPRDHSIGYNDTYLNEEAKAFIDNLDIEFNVYRPNPVVAKPKRQRQKTYTFTCPECGEKITSKNPYLEALCGECGEFFVRTK